MSNKGLFTYLPGEEASFNFLLKLVENLDTYSLKELVKTSIFKHFLINKTLQQKLSKLINEKLYQFRNSLTIEDKLINVFGNLMAFNNDGANIVTVSDNKALGVLNVDTGECNNLLESYADAHQSVAFNHDGTKIVSTSLGDDTIRVWNVDTGECIVTLESDTDEGMLVALNHNGTKIASVDYRKIFVCNIDTGERKIISLNHTRAVSSVGFNHGKDDPNPGTKIVCGSKDNKISVWNVDTGECNNTLEGHWDSVTSVEFNHDGTKIVSGSYDKTIRVWNVDTGVCILTLEGHTGVHISCI